MIKSYRSLLLHPEKFAQDVRTELDLTMALLLVTGNVKKGHGAKVARFVTSLHPYFAVRFLATLLRHPAMRRYGIEREIHGSKEFATLVNTHYKLCKNILESEIYPKNLISLNPSEAAVVSIKALAPGDLVGAMRVVETLLCTEAKTTPLALALSEFLGGAA